LGRIAFHLLLVAANTAGIFFDPNLLHLVSNISFALCLYAENFYLLVSKFTILITLVGQLMGDTGILELLL
jgi:hypothetical protein